MKRGALSKIEINYIETNSDKSKDQIALDLDRSVAQVEKYYKEPAKAVTSGLTEAQKRAKSTFGTKKRNGKTVATVATTASAQLGDEVRKLKKIEPHIHRPYGNE